MGMFTGYYESSTKNTLGCARECSHTLMYQSIPSLTIPRENPGNFLKGRIPSEHKESGRKLVLKPQLFSKIQQKNTKHDIEIMKNVLFY